MIRSESHRLTRAVLCSPGRSYAAGAQGEDNFTESPELDRAKEQHDRLVRTMREAGVEVLLLDELEGHPNAVFVQDPVICTPEGVIALRMGLPSRRDEEEWLTRAITSWGEARAGAIEAPGTVEGGDVILAGEVAFVGLSSRTDEEGARQMIRLLEPMGYEVRTALVPEPFLHLGGSMTPLREDLILCCAGVHPEGLFQGFDVVEIEDQGFISGNVINLGEGAVISHSGNKKAMEALEVRGFQVHSVDLSEFVKGTGGPSCLFQPVERQPC